MTDRQSQSYWFYRLRIGTSSDLLHPPQLAETLAYLQLPGGAAFVAAWLARVDAPFPDQSPDNASPPTISTTAGQRLGKPHYNTEPSHAAREMASHTLSADRVDTDPRQLARDAIS